MRFKIWIDRGGTFTDCICLDAHTGELRVAKLLSSDSSLVEGIRQLLELGPEDPIPHCDVRMGTTLATNALLERKGRPCLLVISRGFGDVLEIGTQARPELFALDIRKPAALNCDVLEVDARCAPDGTAFESYDREEVLRALGRVRQSGIKSVAIVLLHAHKNVAPETALGQLARAAGFEYVALSHDVVEEIGLLARGDTTTVDAYLTPLLQEHLSSVRSTLPGSVLRSMQSSGGLTSAETLRGPHAILSGPAGGVVAYSKLAESAGFEEVIGFDMGGTSTDVSRYAGRFERSYENEVAGVRLRAPMLSIHTVAAGGGSLCRYDGQRFSVGPESAGAKPGPLCYGAAEASDLTVTDVNLVLGRLQVDRFPFALDASRAEAALARIAEQVRSAGHQASVASVAEGFFRIANLNMAEAIRKVSVARGYDVRDHALFAFGGAAGQHACAMAAHLGMRTVLFHSLSGILSAYGMGLADVTAHGEAHVGARALSQPVLDAIIPDYERLEEQARRRLALDAPDPGALESERLVDLRYQGTHTSLTLQLGSAEQLAQRFAEQHAREFGYARPDHAIEVVQLRVQLSAKSPAVLPQQMRTAAPAREPPEPLRHTRLWFDGQWLDCVPVFMREELARGHQVAGPALILEATGTIVIEPGFTLDVHGDLMTATRDTGAGLEKPIATAVETHTRGTHDPVLLEVMNHTYMSIAEQMGQVLRRTAISTNIRERLDFSCAVFDENARLIANAPHIPVHLGAMGESVQAVFHAHPELKPGDVFITNDPAHGGSHLPDVTVVTPVHDATGALSFFVASRGHHADIGGIAPGSMPSDSTSLMQEGVLLPATRIVERGNFDRVLLQTLLTSGPYPARNPAFNIADIEAQIAANQLGVQQLGSLVAEYGLSTVKAYMHHVRHNAEHEVRRAIQQLAPGKHSFEDRMDSGAKLRVSVEIQGSEMRIDFTGTDAELKSNLNAPRAVTVAAVFYFLRTLVDAPIPLNAGCLEPVTLIIPPGCLLAPSPTRAVVGGNVETSQRIVDVLLGAIGKAAASQGTMNNLSFGNQYFGYYETIAGGAGAGSGFSGASGVHTHMTNTRITDAEVLESYYPVRLLEFARRRGSGGRGRYPGGDGLVREMEFLAPVELSLLSERRKCAPFGLHGGEPGLPGRNLLNARELSGSTRLRLVAGDRLRVETPGGGGYGKL